MMKNTRLALCAAVCLISGRAALAQGTGAIHGTVSDPSGGAIVGVPVTATLAERGTTRTVSTGPDGSYVLPGREGLRLQFRSEFFNAFNQVSLGSPSNQLSAGDRMGRITSAGEARVIQFALKVLF